MQMVQGSLYFITWGNDIKKTWSHIIFHLKCAQEASGDNFCYCYRNPNFLTAHFFVLSGSPDRPVNGQHLQPGQKQPTSQHLPDRVSGRRIQVNITEIHLCFYQKLPQTLWSYLILCKCGNKKPNQTLSPHQKKEETTECYCHGSAL